MSIVVAVQPECPLISKRVSLIFLYMSNLVQPRQPHCNSWLCNTTSPAMAATSSVTDLQSTSGVERDSEQSLDVQVLKDAAKKTLVNALNSASLPISCAWLVLTDSF